MQYDLNKTFKNQNLGIVGSNDRDKHTTLRQMVNIDKNRFECETHL